MKRRYRRKMSRLILGMTFMMMAVCNGIFPVERSSAHPLSAAYTTLELSKSDTRMIYSIDEMSVMELAGGDEDRNGMLDQEELDAVQQTLIDILQEHVALKIGGSPQTWSGVENVELERKGSASQVHVTVMFPSIADDLVISLDDSLYAGDPDTRYVNLLTVRYGEKYSTAALSDGNRVWMMRLTGEDYAGLPDTLPTRTEAEKEDSAMNELLVTESGVSGAWSFFLLGVEHILGGYDHLLFLFSILILRQTFKQYAVAISAFTVAHCLTLVLTVLGLMEVSPRLVEPLIALSICYVAADNLIRRKPVANRWVPIFLFGLIHGMGFADLLKEMNIPKSELAVALFSFNVGIEVIQLAIAALFWPLLLFLHRWKYSPQTVMAGSAVALLLGGAWLVERVWL
mgnify:CR=1 FL=1